MNLKKSKVCFSVILCLCLFGCSGVKPVTSSQSQTASTYKSTTSSSAPTSSSTSSTEDKDFKNETGKDADSATEKKILAELNSSSASSSAKTSSKSSSSKSTSSKKATQSAAAPKTQKSTAAATPKKSASPSPSVVRVPKASGTTVLSGNGATIDISNASQGYIMAKCSGTSKRLKLQVKTSKMTYNYDLNNKGTYEVFPLQMGSTSYTVRVMQNVSGTKYSQLYSGTFSAKLSSSLLPFLYPNKFVNFNSSSAAVSKASQICAGCSSDIEKLKAIYNFMITSIKYDYSKAKSVSTGYIPNVDSVLSSRKGICFDYSALMAAMLRSQNIPTQLVIGSAGAAAQNHSWNEVYIRGTGWITVKIKNEGTGWKLLDPTFGDKTGNTSAYAAARVY